MGILVKDVINRNPIVLVCCYFLGSSQAMEYVGVDRVKLELVRQLSGCEFGGYLGAVRFVSNYGGARRISLIALQGYIKMLTLIRNI